MVSDELGERLLLHASNSIVEQCEDEALEKIGRSIFPPGHRWGRSGDGRGLKGAGGSDLRGPLGPLRLGADRGGAPLGWHDKRANSALVTNIAIGGERDADEAQHPAGR